MSTGRTVVQQSVMLPEQIVLGILSKMTRLSINIGTNMTLHQKLVNKLNILKCSCDRLICLEWHSGPV